MTYKYNINEVLHNSIKSKKSVQISQKTCITETSVRYA